MGVRVDCSSSSDIIEVFGVGVENTVSVPIFVSFSNSDAISWFKESG